MQLASLIFNYIDGHSMVSNLNLKFLLIESLISYSVFHLILGRHPQFLQKQMPKGNWFGLVYLENSREVRKLFFQLFNNTGFSSRRVACGERVTNPARTYGSKFDTGAKNLCHTNIHSCIINTEAKVENHQIT